MEKVVIALKIIVCLSLLNVWLVQYNRPSRWRGANAKTIMQEFEAYGLPSWMCYAIGFLKVGFAMALLASIWYPAFETSAATVLAILLSGSILMHIKIKDAPLKSFPATLFLVFCVLIIYL
ncbi:MAG: hypothetical protein ACI8RH_001471 [Flavobacteriales bacterium]|jgi:hypothetical protein